MDDLRVQLEIDSSGVKQGATQVNQAMESTVQPVSKVLGAVEGLNDALKEVPESAQKIDQGMRKVKETADTASTGLGRTASSAKSIGSEIEKTAGKVSVSQKQFDTMVKKLGEYQAKFADAAKEEAELAKKIKEANEQIQAALKVQPNADMGLLRLTEGLPQLEAQMQSVIDKQIEYGEGAEILAVSLENVEIAQKQVGEGAEGMSRMLATMSMSAAATTARLAGADGLASALSAVGSSVSAFMLAGSNPTSLAVAAVTTGMNAINVVVELIQHAGKKVEDQLRKIKESAKSIPQAIAQEWSAIADLATLKATNTLLEDQVGARQQLEALFPELVVGWNAEKKAILASNMVLEDAVNLYRELLKLDTQDAARIARNTFVEQATSISQAKSELKGFNNQLEIASTLLSSTRSPILDTAESAIAARVSQTERTMLEMKETARVALSDIKYMFGDLNEVQQIAVNSALEEYLTNNTEALRGLGDETVSMIDKQRSWNEFLNEAVRVAESATTNTELLAAAQDQYAASSGAVAKSLEEMRTVGADAHTDMKRIFDEFERIGNMKGAVKVIEDYSSAMKSGGRDTEQYSKAIKYLAQQYGVTEQAIKDNLSMYKNEIALKEAMIKAEYGRAAMAAWASKAEAEAMVAAGTITRSQADVIIAALDGVIGKYVEWASIAGPGGVPITFDFEKGTSGGGGGGGGSSARKKAWESELEMIERVKTEMDDIGYVYVAMLEKMLEDQRLSATERQRIEKELAYATAGELQQTYIDYLQGILEKQKLNADERLQVEQKLVQAQKDLHRQTLQDLDALGNAVVDALRNRYAAEQEASAESLSNQVQAAQNAASAEKEAINEARDAEVKKLQSARDDQIKLIEEIRDARIKAVEDERDAVVAGLEEQIKAIDDYIKARDRSEKDNEDEKKLARLKTELAFEKDAYNQIKLQEQIIQLEKDIARRKEDERLADEKAALKEQLAEVKTSSSDEIKAIKDKAAEQLAITKETAAAQIEMVKESAAQQLKILQAQLDAEIANLQQRQKENEEYWKQRLSNEALMGEALVLLNNGTQEEILQLLKDYNPNYLKAGNEMGQMLYDGFDSKYRDLLARTDEVSRDIIAKANAAIAAWQAMQAITSKSGSSGSSSSMWSASGAAAPFSGLQNFAQQLIALPDTLDNLITGALYNMTEAPRNYYATRAAEAGLDNYAVADFSNGNLNAVTAAGVAARATAAPGDVDTVMSSLGRRKDVNLVVNIYRPEQTPYQTAKEIERISRRLID